MSQNFLLKNAELNKKYCVKKIIGDDTKLMKFGIYEGSPIVPLFRSMSGNLCAYKTHYGVFAIRNDTAEKIVVSYER